MTQGDAALWLFNRFMVPPVAAGMVLAISTAVLIFT